MGEVFSLVLDKHFFDNGVGWEAGWEGFSEFRGLRSGILKRFTVSHSVPPLRTESAVLPSLVWFAAQVCSLFFLFLAVGRII